jgi:hypothetical protein
VHDFTNERIDRHHAFGLQFAERHANRPLIRARGVQAIAGEVGCLADAHAGMAQQQEHIRGEVIASEQFLLEGLILFGGKWARQALWAPRHISGP